MPQGTWSGLLLVMLALAFAPSLLSCAAPKPSAARPSYPAMGTVVTLGDRRVKATGVVARYPRNATPGALSWSWALYSALGSETASPGIIALLQVHPLETPQVRGLSPDATAGALVSFDGRLVTVEGTMTPRDRSSGHRSTRWPVLAVTAIATAPPDAQPRVVWKDALVQPGRWFDEPWRYSLAQAYEALGNDPGGGYYDLAAAEKAFGSPIPSPKGPLTGRLVGVVLTRYNTGPPRTWQLIYASGMNIEGPIGGPRGRNVFVKFGPDWILSTLKAKSSSHERLVHVNGHPGLIGEMNGLGPGVFTRYIFFWDGQEVVSIEYAGLGSGPSDKDLVAIAESMGP